MSLSLLVFGVFYSCQGEATFPFLVDNDDVLSEAATGLSPEFLGTISNLTISQGRDASFACSVRNLGGYKVHHITNTNEREFLMWKKIYRNVVVHKIGQRFRRM